jgi:hypothetical protein
MGTPKDHPGVPLGVGISLMAGARVVVVVSEVVVVESEVVVVDPEVTGGVRAFEQSVT